MSRDIKIKKHLILKRIIFMMMLISTFCVIFQFSAQDGAKSSSVSTKVTNKIVDVISKVKHVSSQDRTRYVNKLQPYVRKLAHFSIYTLVGFSIMGFFCTFDIRNKYKLLWSLLIGIVYASSDEIHQSFTPGRSPRLFDVGIDTLGVITGIFIMIFLIIIIENISNWLKR